MQCRKHSIKTGLHFLFFYLFIHTAVTFFWKIDFFLVFSGYMTTKKHKNNKHYLYLLTLMLNSDEYSINQNPNNKFVLM